MKFLQIQNVRTLILIHLIDLQLNNIVFYAIKIDFFDAGEFVLWQAAAFDFQ